METKNVEVSEKKMVNNGNEDGITLNDIIILKNLVNISARRGAFSVEEFKEIGELYEKVDKFCKFQAKLLEDKEKDESSDGVENKMI
tara:strand:- start:122 stop:382 length:261 start_codon:yes stop_codon:yes gene_type:complete